MLFSAGFEGRCANLSGFGLNVDLIVRIEVYATGGVEIGEALCCARAIRVRVDDGRRNEGGSRPQLRAAFGGIVGPAALVVD